ncbi:hypothetical protein [Brucella sp. 10RB9213]|uniref:phage nozzle protein n=1 Tax=Brucella sp. 10RB9213 TaxID=1844039 RepID=UPI0012AD6CD0|nr:hypothetical protein [Brucella sp. 10RB9213]MRN66404.1 hypothetical protein [Brucella sp. 10RB9213]
MTLISSTIPNLVNGVSQQPSSLRLASQCELQENGHSSVVEGLKKRPPARFVAKISDTSFGTAFVHMINRDAVERYAVVITNGNLRVFRMDGSEVPVAFPHGRDYLATAAADRDFTAVTIADYTFILNSTRTAYMTGDLTPSRPKEALVWIKQGAYAQNYTINISGFQKTFTTPDGSDKSHTAQIATDAIMGNLVTQFMSDANFTGQYALNHMGSTIRVSRHDGGDFGISSADGLGDQAIKVCKDTAQRFSDLPARGFHGFRIEIGGDQSSAFDNYWVEFWNPTGGSSTGIWRESSKGGEHYRINGATMPYALKRLSNGTFSFEQIPWDDRKVGDAESVPEPSFIGKQINDIFFHRNRLGLVADENVVFSRAGEFFNFWRSSATQTLDTDMIDVAVSHTKVSIIRHAIPFNETLLLFSDQTQFMLGAADTLTPYTISINQTTEFQASLLAKPVGAGRNIYFAMNKGAYSGIREYYVDGQTKTNDAADVTAHVPKYIPGSVTKLAASSNEDVLVALSPNEKNALYVYKYYWQELEKLQSSWSKWILDPDTTVLYVDFIESDLWMLVERHGQVLFEVISLEAGRADPGINFAFHLDQRVNASQCSVVYDAANDVTKITMPYKVTKPDQYQFIGVGNGPYRMGQIIPLKWDANNTFIIAGNVTNFIAGLKYTFRYRLSKLVIKEEAVGGGQMAVGAGRMQLRRMTLTYNDTGYFRAEVKPFRRETYTSVFSGRVTGGGRNIIGEPALESGRFRFPISGKSEETDIEIVNDSPLPCALLSAEWEATFIIRSRRT